MIDINSTLAISPAGLDVIKHFEGWYPKAYKDPVGVWTIGWGTTGVEAQPGRTITKKQGEEFLRRDVIDAENDVKRLVKVELEQYQFDALVSFVYNVGATNFAKSTLLKLLNRGNYVGAAGQFLRWNKARDRETNKYITLPGLTRRRGEEAALFSLSPDAEYKYHDLEDAHLKVPENHDANVMPEGVEKNEDAWSKMIQNSDSFKALSTAITGMLVALSQLTDPLKENPVLFGAILISLIGAGTAIYIKKRDTSEGR